MERQHGYRVGYRDTDPNGEKDINNGLVRDALVQEFSVDYLRTSGRVLVLDGPSMRTTTILKNIVANIHIPQKDDGDYRDMIKRIERIERGESHTMRHHNLRPKKHNTHTKHGHSVTVVTHETLREFIDRQPKDIIEKSCGYYLDYMGMVYGSVTRGEYPMTEMDEILRQTKQDKLVFAMTFCSRMYVLHDSFFKKEKEASSSYERKSTGQILYDFLYPMFTSRGFAIRRQIIREYSKDVETAPMVFFLFVLERSPTKIPMTLFHMHPSMLFRIGYDQTLDKKTFFTKKSTSRYKNVYKKYFDVSKHRWRLPVHTYPIIEN